VEPINELLQDIAVHIWEGEHGAFLQSFAGLYLLADEKKKKLLRPVWRTLIEENLLKKSEVAQKAVD